jgi:tripeptide aminopeptidase
MRYVKVHTTSNEENEHTPSSECQWDLARMLVAELQEIGIEDVRLDEHCYVYAVLPENLPANSPRSGKIPAVGLIAHMDVSPAVSGVDVKPILHERYDGKPIPLPGDPDLVLDPAVEEGLAEAQGLDIITSDGTTLLGADDKSGIAVIVAVLRYLRSHPEVHHGPVHVAFTPDEEVGRGVDEFDLASFGAEVAYTIDGKGCGEIEDETFFADSMDITIRGINVHPGYAKGKMINSVKLAAELIDSLPHDSRSPETTDGREGYLHPMAIQGNEESTSIKFIMRDFTAEGLVELERFLEDRARTVERAHPGCRIDIEIKHSYKNMKVMLDQRPEAAEFAEEAIRAAGIEVHRNPIRGGTDGARLSFMGLPTPNLFAGGFNFHGKKEWVPVQYMEKSAEVCLRLLQIWAERGEKKGLVPVAD